MRIGLFFLRVFQLIYHTHENALGGVDIFLASAVHFGGGEGLAALFRNQLYGVGLVFVCAHADGAVGFQHNGVAVTQLMQHGAVRGGGFRGIVNGGAVRKDIKAGEKFTEENVRSVRPGFGLHPKYLPEIIGKIAKRDLEKGERFSLDMI